MVLTSVFLQLHLLRCDAYCISLFFPLFSFCTHVLQRYSSPLMILRHLLSVLVLLFIFWFRIVLKVYFDVPFLKFFPVRFLHTAGSCF